MVVPSPPNGSNGKKKRNKNAHQSNHYRATHHSGSKADRKSGGKAGKGNKSINKLFHFGQTGPHLAKFKRQQELKKAKRASKSLNKNNKQKQQQQQHHHHRPQQQQYRGANRKKKRHHHYESSPDQATEYGSGSDSQLSSNDYSDSGEDEGYEHDSDFETGFTFSPSHDTAEASSSHPQHHHNFQQPPLKRLQPSHQGPKRYTLDDHLPIYQQSGKTTTNFERYLSHSAVAPYEDESFSSSVTSSRSGSPNPSSSTSQKALSRQARRHEERERARALRRSQLEQAKQNRPPLFEEYKEGDLEHFEERARLRNKIRKQEALLRQNPGRAKEILRQQQQQTGEEIIFVQPNAPVNNKKKNKRERQQQLLQQIRQQTTEQHNNDIPTTTTIMNNNSYVALQEESDGSRSPSSDMEVSSGGESPTPQASTPPAAVDDLQTGADYIAFDISDDESEFNKQQQIQVAPRPTSVVAGSKRKRGTADDDSGSDTEGATGPPPNCPWMGHRRYSRMKNVPVMLTQELKDFVAYISPTREEHQVRKYVFMRIERTVKQLWPEASLHIFGSYETMLYLPSSDLDVVVKFPWTYATKHLMELARRLRSDRVASWLQSIAKARVPIIKMRESITDLAVDISFNIDNGVQSAIMVKRFMEAAPGLKPLTMLVKHFLMLKDFNEPYIGGLGSYTTMIMILSFLQQHDKVRTGEIDPNENLGPLLIEFFELYGFKFNYERVGISVVGRGRYLPKPASAARPNQGGRFGGGGRFRQDEFLIYCEDPNDATNDTGRPSYKMRQIREVFAGAHSELSRRVQERHQELFGKFEGGHSTSSSHIRFDDRNQVAADSREKSHGLHREREQEKSLIHGVLSIPYKVIQSRQKLENVFYRGIFQDMFGHPHGLEGLDKIEAEEAQRKKMAEASSGANGGVCGNGGSSLPPPQHHRFVGASDTSDEEGDNVIEVSDDDNYDDYNSEEKDEYEQAFENMLSQAREDLGFDEDDVHEVPTANKNPANVASSEGSIQLPQIFDLTVAPGGSQECAIYLD
ncbi:hypothetical protein BGW42_002673 [Actinomortierella wolfii]|nr:hypothetical protein BGW42_002673 [Actinomortierella wolfii]